MFIDFCLKKLSVFSQHIGKKKTNEYLNPAEQIPRNWNVDQLSVLITFWDITKWHSINISWKELMECMSEHTGLISSLSLLLVQSQAARWKAATPEQLTGAQLYLNIAKSGYLFHAVGNVTEHFCPSICLYVCLPVTPFSQCLYHHEIYRIYYHCKRWCPCNRSNSEVKGPGHRGPNKFWPNLGVSGL